MADTTYTTFIDNAGRTIFGEQHEISSTSVTVKNPVMITVQPQQSGQMAVQLFPLFFPEFIHPVKGEDDKEERSTLFTYSLQSIAVGSNFEIEPRIVEQYTKVVNPVLVPAGEQQAPSSPEVQDAEVIQLFDE